MNFEAQQLAVCQQYSADAFATPVTLKVGISQSALSGLLPLNGLRYPPEGDTSGWFIWGGEEWSEADDFFLPVHIHHLYTELPSVVKYLLLPPGWRFLTDAKGYEDVWTDEQLV